MFSQDQSQGKTKESSVPAEIKLNTRPPLPKHNKSRHKNRFDKAAKTSENRPETQKKQHSVEKPLEKENVETTVLTDKPLTKPQKEEEEVTQEIKSEEKQKDAETSKRADVQTETKVEETQSEVTSNSLPVSNRIRFTDFGCFCKLWNFEAKCGLFSEQI